MRRSGAARRLLARLRREERGAVTLIFALVSVFVLVPTVLISVDAYVAASQKGRLQDALDSATLFAARSPADEDAELQVLGEKALKANLEIIGGEPATLLSSSFTINEAGTEVTGTARVMPKTFFNWCDSGTGDGFCWTGGPVTSTTKVERGLEITEIALVLDNTGSMQTGSRMGTLKVASKKMIDTLKDAAKEVGQEKNLKIALVPFSNTVRVVETVDLGAYAGAVGGASGVPTWIDPQGRAHAAAGTDRETFSVTMTDRLALMKAVGDDWDGCVESRRPPNDVVETAPDAGNPATLFTPYFWPDEPGNKSTTNRNDYLNDVTGSSDFKTRSRFVGKYVANARNGTYNFGGSYGGPYKYGPNSGCNLPALVRLTSDWPSLKTGINAMHPIGETNITIGLMWGWHVLTPNAPFADGVPYNTPRSKKIIVLMTDGENTLTDPINNGHESLYGGFGYIWQRMVPGVTESSGASTRTKKIDERLELLCSNVKARGIIIYTVRLEVKNPTSDSIVKCATEPGKFYDVEDETGLEDAFDAIAEDIKALRIMQ